MGIPYFLSSHGLGILGHCAVEVRYALIAQFSSAPDPEVELKAMNMEK